jgi:rhodanese-related sulfurtransferase
MKPFRILLALLFLAALSSAGFGGDFGYVTSAELKTMIDRNEPGLLIIDSRPLSQFEENHIPGAISIPLNELERKPELPKAGKDARLVFYCSGNT